jgi:hypothetical protein
MKNFNDDATEPNVKNVHYVPAEEQQTENLQEDYVELDKEELLPEEGDDMENEDLEEDADNMENEDLAEDGDSMENEDAEQDENFITKEKNTPRSGL